MSEKELKQKVKTIKKIIKTFDVIIFICLILFSFFVGMMLQYYVSNKDIDSVDNTHLYNTDHIRVYRYPDRVDIYQLLFLSADGTLYTVMHVEKENVIKLNERINLLLNEN